MLEFRVPEVGDKILFEAVLEPTDPAVKFAKGRGIGEDKIIKIRGKKNRVAVGVPYYENLISRLVEEGKEIPREIKKMSDENDFHFVSLSCSFLPDDDCKFVWARFGVELSARSKSGTLLDAKTIAHDMFPNEVLSKIKCKKNTSFTPKLEFSFGPLEAGADIDISTQREFIVYEPQIIAFGVKTSKAIWDFKSTQEKGIWGNKKNLLLIVRTPKESKVKGRFLLGAEVGCKLTDWIPIPISKRKEKAVDAKHDLSE